MDEKHEDFEIWFIYEIIEVFRCAKEQLCMEYQVAPLTRVVH